MNETFCRKLQESGLTMYALAKQSGVSYTTVNELCRGKLDINRCSAEIVWRLSAILSAEMGALLNPVRFLDGMKGSYRGIEYVWYYEGETGITFEDEGETVSLSTGKDWNMPSRIKYYQTAAGWMIKEYIEHKRWETSADALEGKKLSRGVFAADHL